MPLFRFQNGSLEQSLLTTVIVKNINQLKCAIELKYTGLGYGNINGFAIDIKPYGTIFDGRIGWYTHLVSCDIGKKDIFLPIGYLSEPF